MKIPTKIIVAGSRTITDFAFVCECIEEGLTALDISFSEMVEGGANGVDLLAKKYAIERKIPGIEFKARWDIHGKAAGYKRNEKMAAYVGETGALIAIRKDNSRGTTHMINIAKQYKLKIWVKDI